MKLIIAGSRGIYDYNILLKALRKWWTEVVKLSTDTNKANHIIEEIISGNADGIDKLGERFASENAIDLVIMPANWKKYGKSAGPRRNAKMAERGTHLVAIWDGTSRGTTGMIKIATNLKLNVFIYDVSKDN